MILKRSTVGIALTVLLGTGLLAALLGDLRGGSFLGQTGQTGGSSSAASSGPCQIAYFASLNTLPTAQGWEGWETGLADTSVTLKQEGNVRYLEMIDNSTQGGVSFQSRDILREGFVDHDWTFEIKGRFRASNYGNNSIGVNMLIVSDGDLQSSLYFDKSKYGVLGAGYSPLRYANTVNADTASAFHTYTIEYHGNAAGVADDTFNILQDGQVVVRNVSRSDLYDPRSETGDGYAVLFFGIGSTGGTGIMDVASVKFTGTDCRLAQNVAGDQCSPASSSSARSASASSGGGHSSDAGSLCGNGSRDRGEQCDDANRSDGDCCSGSCTVEPNCFCSEQTPSLSPSSQCSDASAKIFTKQADFLQQSGAVSAGPYRSTPHHAQSITMGPVTLSSVNTDNKYPDLVTSDQNAVYANPLPGLSLLISGREDMDVRFAAPVYGFGFDFYEPQTNRRVANVTASRIIDSLFEVTLLNGTTPVDSFTFNAPNDVVSFVGIWSPQAFNRATIRERTGTNDNEVFGKFYTTTTALSPSNVTCN